MIGARCVAADAEPTDNPIAIVECMAATEEDQAARDLIFSSAVTGRGSKQRRIEEIGLAEAP